MTAEFWTVLAASALYFFAFGAVTALLPKYVVDELGGTEATAGFVMGSMAISALLVRVWFGRLGDRQGARMLIVLGCVLGVIGYLVLALWASLTGTVVSRLITGGAGAAVVTGSTMLAIQVSPIQRRGQAASFTLIAFHVGMGLGPVAGDFLLSGGDDFTTVWIVAAAIVGVAIPVTLMLPRRDGSSRERSGPLIQRQAVWPGIVTLLGMFAFSGFLQFVPLYGREVGLEGVGAVFLAASLTIIVVRLAFGWVPDRVGPIIAGSAALGITVVAATTVALWDATAGIFVGAVLLACGLSMQAPSFIPMAVHDVPDDERGSAMATYTGFFDIANILVGPILGVIVVSAGYTEAFLTTAALALASLVILNSVVSRQWYSGGEAR